MNEVKGDNDVDKRKSRCEQHTGEKCGLMKGQAKIGHKCKERCQLPKDKSVINRSSLSDRFFEN